MPRIFVCELPEHFRDTPLGRALLGDAGDGEINCDAIVDIPDAYYCSVLDTSAITTAADFKRLLEMYRYWGASRMLMFYVFDLVWNQPSFWINSICYSTFPELADGLLDQIDFIYNRPVWQQDIMAKIGYWGYLDIMQYAHERGYEWDSRTCEYAAQRGHLSCLKYAHEHGCPWGKWPCAAAACNGHLECLQFAHENGCPWDELTCKEAAFNGKLACLQYAHEHGCPWDERTSGCAALTGHLACLQYAHEHGCPINSYVYSSAMFGGTSCLACLQYLQEQGIPKPN